jgi:hypothetical protein
MSSWAPSPPDACTTEIISSGPLDIAWCEDFPGAHLEHWLRMEGGPTEGTPQIYVYQALAKAICHLLVSALPDAALPEVGESLARLYSFYSAPPAVFRLEPPRLWSAGAIRGTTHPRPEIEITEE